MSILTDLRFQRDQCLHIAISYDAIAQEKSNIEYNKDRLNKENARLEDNLIESHDTIRQYKKKYLKVL